MWRGNNGLAGADKVVDNSEGGGGSTAITPPVCEYGFVYDPVNYIYLPHKTEKHHA